MGALCLDRKPFMLKNAIFKMNFMWDIIENLEGSGF